MTPAHEILRARLFELGFDAVRFAAVETPPSTFLPEWLAGGMHADMEWIARTSEKRIHPEEVLPGVRSVIALGVNYWSRHSARGGPTGTVATWARYALHEDYHDTLKPALQAAGRAIEEVFGVGTADYRYYADTGPVLERGWADRAGLGFVGKNTMLISREHGNWLLLSDILTTVELPPDPRLERPMGGERPGAGLLCGKCTRCLDACPTDAFPAAGVLDARRCISYQTIENRGIIPRELRAGIGNRVFGCDVCLEVCPWNRFAQEGRKVLLVARDELAGLTVADLLALTQERFAAVFRRTPVKRLKLAGLLRNACIVAGNSGDATLVEPLARLARHELPLVRAHAVWAVFRLAPDRAGELLAEARGAEGDPEVLAEYS